MIHIRYNIYIIQIIKNNYEHILKVMMKQNLLMDVYLARESCRLCFVKGPVPRENCF